MTNESQMLAKFENLNMNSNITGGMITDYWYDYWPRNYTTYWPSYSQDTFKQAFKVVSMMIEKGYLDKITLKKFITLVKEVESEL